MKLLKELFIKYKSIIMYLFFGVCTTLVNIISYYIFAHILKSGVMFSTIIAWILAVLFAYVTNRKWVFKSYAKSKKEIFNEIVSFFSCRLATGFVDWLCMFIFVERIGLNDVIIKTLANILVIILNYVASKLIIFKKKDEKESSDRIINLLIYGLFFIIAFMFLFESPLHIWNGGEAGVDSSVFKTIAIQISKGYAPYVDTFDHKGPLIYAVNYIGYLISPYRGVWVIELISLFVTICYLFKIARLKCNKLLSIIIAVLGITLLSNFFEGGNFTEEYALPFISISLYYFLDYLMNKKIDRLRLLICGLSFGAVFMLRPNMIATWAVFCAYIFFKCIIDKDYKSLKIFVIYFIIGFILCLLPFVIWLACKGSLAEFIKDYFLFNKTYTTTHGIKGTITGIWKLIFGFINYPLIIISFLTIMYLIKYKKLHILYLAYMVINIIFICMSGNYYPHYMIIFIPVIIFPLACLFDFIKTNDNKNNIIGSLVGLYLIVNFICPYWIDVVRYLPSKYSHRNDYKISDEMYEMSSIIKEKTNENDKISVFGNRNILYLLSNRMPATKYSYQYPIIYMSEEISKNYYESLKKETPKIIVTAEHDENFIKFLDDNNYKSIYETTYNNRQYNIYELTKN